MARQQGDRHSRSLGGSTATADRMATRGGSSAGEVRTRATYRLLLMRGLDSAEAANLTAYLCGIDVTETPWSIGEINRLLFLRSLARSGRWGAGEDAMARQKWPAAA